MILNMLPRLHSSLCSAWESRKQGPQKKTVSATDVRIDDLGSTLSFHIGIFLDRVHWLVSRGSIFLLVLEA